MKIFILEDDGQRIGLFREYAGLVHDLTVANSPFEATTLYKPGEFDIMLLDHDLGTTSNGQAFCQWLKESHPQPEVPCVLIHSWNPDGAAEMRKILKDIGWKNVGLAPFGKPVLEYLRRLA